MDLITIIEDEFVWASAKGRYYQLPLYRRGDQLFVKVGGAFIGLYRGGTTTRPELRWHQMTFQLFNHDSVGRLTLSPKVAIAA